MLSSHKSKRGANSNRTSRRTFTCKDLDIQTMKTSVRETKMSAAAKSKTPSLSSMSGPANNVATQEAPSARIANASPPMTGKVSRKKQTSIHKFEFDIRNKEYGDEEEVCKKSDLRPSQMDVNQIRAPTDQEINQINQSALETPEGEEGIYERQFQMMSASRQQVAQGGDAATPPMMLNSAGGPKEPYLQLNSKTSPTKRSAVLSIKKDQN